MYVEVAFSGPFLLFRGMKKKYTSLGKSINKQDARSLDPHEQKLLLLGLKPGKILAKIKQKWTEYLSPRKRRKEVSGI